MQTPQYTERLLRGISTSIVILSITALVAYCSVLVSGTFRAETPYAQAADPVLTTPTRSLDPTLYLEAPKITIQGNDFAVEYKGTTTRYVRPTVAVVNIAPAGGKIIYVAPDGSGSQNGTFGNAFASIQQALNVANPGDTVEIAQGEYAEVITVPRSGTASQPIKITAAPGALPRVTLPYGQALKGPFIGVDQNGNTITKGNSIFTVNGKSHIWINGLVLEGAIKRADWPHDANGNPIEEEYSACGVYIPHLVAGFSLTNTVTYFDGHVGFKSSTTGATFDSNIAFWVGNTGRDHGVYHTANDSTIRGNLTFGNAGYGLHIYAGDYNELTDPNPHPSNNVIERNLSVDNRIGGVVVSGPNNYVRNNTFVSNRQAGGIYLFRITSIGNVLKGNIVAFNTNTGDKNVNRQNIGYDCNGQAPVQCPSGNVSDYNLIYPNEAPNESQYRGVHDLYNQNPLFLDAANGDYRLLSNSPARGMGESGTDIGAFTYSVITNVPTPTASATPTATPTLSPTPTPTSTPPAQLTVTLTADKTGPVRSGDIITYTVEVSNAGEGIATNPELTNVVPAGTTYVTGSSVGATFDGAKLTWKWGSIGAVKKVVTYQVRVL